MLRRIDAVLASLVRMMCVCILQQLFLSALRQNAMWQRLVDALNSASEEVNRNFVGRHTRLDLGRQRKVEG